MQYLAKKYNPPQDVLLSFAPKIFELEGFGPCKFDVDLNRDTFRVTYTKSSIAKAYIDLFGESDTPVCILVAGYLAGFASFAFGKDVDVKETKCKAKGDPICEFTIC